MTESGVPGAYFEVTGKESELFRIMDGINSNAGRLSADDSASLDLWQEMLEDWFRIHDKMVWHAGYEARYQEEREELGNRG